MHRGIHPWLHAPVTSTGVPRNMRDRSSAARTAARPAAARRGVPTTFSAAADNAPAAESTAPTSPSDRGLGMVFRLAQNDAGKPMYDHGAFTRSELREGIVEVRARWRAYVRRHRIRAPVVHDVAWFLWTEYRLPMPDDDVVVLLRPALRLKMAQGFPRIAAMLLEGGVLPVSRS